jgi:DNA-binding beta-propeller fold protein YncE
MKTTSRLAVAAAALIAAYGYHIAPTRAQGEGAEKMPVFEVDRSWPKVPNDWVLGIVSSVTTDKRDHVWILHRPRTVQENLKGKAAPPVLEYDANGAFIRAWGGPGAGYDWPGTEHGITVDHTGTIWIGGSGVTDDMLLKFTLDGKFISQIGARGQSKGNADSRNVNRPADLFVHPTTNEAFVADGYGNRRVIVFDAKTGGFKRMWGAFGKPPDNDPPAGAPGASAPAGRGGAQAPAPVLDTEGSGSERFGNPVHAIKISNDNLVYVADRSNRRVQVFTPEGKYVNQVFINRAGPAAGSAAGLAFSPDRDQQFLYVSDLGNSHVAVVNRKTLKVLYQFGARGSTPGDFQAPHHMSVDSKGNLYTAEVNPGNRAQRFVFKGMSAAVPANAIKP